MDQERALATHLAELGQQVHAYLEHSEERVMRHRSILLLRQCIRIGALQTSLARGETRAAVWSGEYSASAVHSTRPALHR
jgi:hypothetical protein